MTIRGYLNGYRLYGLDLDQANFAGQGYGVVSGTDAYANGDDAYVRWNAGVVRNGLGELSISAGALDLSPYQHASLHKKVLVAVDNITGTVKVVAGTAATARPLGLTGRYAKEPTPPDYLTLGAGDVVLAEVWLPPAGSAILSAYVSDRRWGVSSVQPRLIEIPDTTTVGLDILKPAGQTADLFRARSSSATDFRVDANGGMSAMKIMDVRCVNPSGSGAGFASLSAALADQGATAGGAVFMSAGTHAMPNTALSVPYDTQICGAHMRKSLLQWSDVVAANGLVLAANAGLESYAVLRDMRLLASTSKVGHAISIPTVNNYEIRRVSIDSWGNNGIDINGTPYSSIYGKILQCEIENTNKGIVAYNDTRVTEVVGNWIHGQHGLQNSNVGIGISLVSAISFWMSHNTLESMNTGITLNGSASCDLSRNYFEALTLPISLNNVSSLCKVEGCWGYNLSYAVQLDNAYYCRVADNKWTGCYGVGMRINAAATGCVAQNNWCVNSSSANVPWSVGTITAEPLSIEATLGGTGSLYPQIIRGTSMARFVEQATQPTLTQNGEMQYWRDTDDSKVYLIVRINGVDKKVELI